MDKNVSYFEIMTSRCVNISRKFEQPSCVVPDGETSPALAFKMYAKGQPLPFHDCEPNGDQPFFGGSYPKSKEELLMRRKEFAEFVSAQNPPAQNPPAQNPPAQNPPAQNPPAQNPPAAQ